MNFIKSLREPVNSLTHWGAAVLALGASLSLILINRETPGRLIPLVIYGASLIVMFSASGTYHAVRVGERALEAFRKLDHAAIYLLIAGTYTPFCMNAFAGFWSAGLMGLIWTLALVGIVIKLIIVRAPRWVNAGIYVIMGWIAVFAFRQLVLLPIPVFAWLIVGGVIYTLGAIVYVTKLFNFVPGRFGFHEVWHIFVMLGAAAHFMAVLQL